MLETDDDGRLVTLDADLSPEDTKVLGELTQIMFGKIFQPMTRSVIMRHVTNTEQPIDGPAHAMLLTFTEALDTIERVTGKQFDAELALRGAAEMLSELNVAFIRAVEMYRLLRGSLSGGVPELESSTAVAELAKLFPGMKLVEHRRGDDDDINGLLGCG